jgi:hypothetical protein
MHPGPGRLLSRRVIVDTRGPRAHTAAGAAFSVNCSRSYRGGCSTDTSEYLHHTMCLKRSTSGSTTDCNAETALDNGLISSG